VRNFFVIALIGGAAGTAFAAAEFQVTFTGGAVRSLPAFHLDGGYLQTAEGRVGKTEISSVRFVAAPLTEELCRTLFAEGRYGEIVAGLDECRPSLLAAAGTPGNAEPFLRWLIQASFWNGGYSSVQEMARSLQSSGHPMAPWAAFYAAMALLEQNRTDEFSAQLALLENKDGISPVMIEYARARAAFAREQYTDTLRHLAQVMLAHGRDSEWTPAALVLERMVYSKTGEAEAAGSVADELRLGWPDSGWSRRAGELK
jgi:hypothetical protein